ncbi:MAG: class I SAM-dependent methyltransferase [Patescibacteria group bacterium]
MSEKFWENLTENQDEAQFVWRMVRQAIERVGRQDILQNPAVLDLGGGAGEFAKYLNAQGLQCVSLDVQDWGTNPESQPIRGDAYKTPFADGSFDIVHGYGIFDNAMYHHNFAKLLPEIARILKTRGILSIFGANSPPMEELRKHFKSLEHSLWEKK